MGKEVNMSETNNEKAISKNEAIEMYLKNNFSFRYNVIKCKPEIRLKNENGYFKPVDRYILNSLKRKLDADYKINTSADNIKSILESNFSKKVNPIIEYFKNLPEYSEKKDYIKELSETVKVNNDQGIFYEYLKKWLVAVVANAMTVKGCQNHTCLVLTGEQGKFKTTWLDLLCPKVLNQYHFTGKLNLQSKDTLAFIAEMLFINIDDQLRQINKRDENELKNLITTPFVKYRRPYDIYITDYPHTASFMASVNGNDFLTDPTGSRRFLPFEVSEININEAKKIDMENVYSQAVYLYKKGFRYWFNEEEIDILHKHNQAFQVISIEEQLLIQYFAIPETRQDATDHLQSAIIQAELERLGGYTKLSVKKLGEALNKLGFEKWQKTEGKITKWVWSVIRRDLEDVELSNKVAEYQSNF